MKGSSRVALALAAGYVLGRRHKLRTAILLAGATASGRLSSLGGAAVKRGAAAAGSSGLLEKVIPQMSGITSTVRGELANAGKAAAMAVVNNRIESLSDSLHQRTEALRGGSMPSGGRAESFEEDESSDREADDWDEPRDGRDEPADEDELEDRSDEPEGRAERDETDEPPEDQDDEEWAEEPEDSYDSEDEEEPEGDYDEAEEDEEAGGPRQRRSTGRRTSPVSRAGR